MNIFENKAFKINHETFDDRVLPMVLCYIVTKGTEMVAHISDEDIDALEGNGLMTEDFVQQLVKTARQICQECDVNADILPAIAYYYMPEEEEDEYE